MLMSCSERMTSMCTSPEMSTSSSSSSSPSACLLLQDVLGHLAGAVVELGHHGVAGAAVDRLDRRDQAGGDVQRRLRHVVLVGRGEIDRHGLIAQLDVLGPEDRPVRAGLEESEEVVLDRHVPMKPAPTRRRYPVTARRHVSVEVGLSRRGMPRTRAA